MDTMSVCMLVVLNLRAAAPQRGRVSSRQQLSIVFSMKHLSYSSFVILKITNRFLQRNLMQDKSRKKFSWNQNQQRSEVTADSCRVLLWPGTAGRCGHGT